MSPASTRPGFGLIALDAVLVFRVGVKMKGGGGLAGPRTLETARRPLS
jgi:hypothetical protein